MNSLRSAWEVVNPWSETQGTVRRMRGKARYLETLKRRFEKGQIQPAQRDALRAKNKVEFRATDDVEYKSTEGFFWNVTALDAIRWFGTRKTDDGEGEIMKSAAGKLERACPQRTFMTAERARARRERAAR